MVYVLLLPPPPSSSSSSVILQWIHFGCTPAFGGGGDNWNNKKELTTVSLRTACYFLNTPITIPRADLFYFLRKNTFAVVVTSLYHIQGCSYPFFCLCCYRGSSHSHIIIPGTECITSNCEKMYISTKENAVTKQRKSSTNECKSINEPTNELHHFVCLLYCTHCLQRNS